MESRSAAVKVGVNFGGLAQTDRMWAYHTVDPNDVIVSKWDLIRQDVLQVLKELPWAVLSVVRSSYGKPIQWDAERNAIILDDFYPPEPMPEPNPIILVGTSADSHDSWQAMAEQIYLLCTNAGLGHCRVLFESARYPLTAGAEPVHYRLHDDIEFPIGSSFGPVKGGKESTASIGGTIKLKEGDQDGESESTFLLSVFHPFSKLVTDKECCDGWRHSSAPAIEVQMPSVEDTDEEIITLQDRIQNMLVRMEHNQNAGSITPAERIANEERFMRKIEQYQTDLQEQERHKYLGRGLLQYGSSLGRSLDWSLLAFDHRKVDNFPPTEKDVDDTLDNNGAFHREAIGSWLGGYIDIKEIGLAKAELNSIVIKQGRTTGVTVGMVNALPSDIIMSKAASGFNKEVVIGVRAIIGPYPFNQPGDSGAWVLNSDGDWIGSVIGAQTSQKTGESIALIIEAEKIVKDIEEFTGKKVVTPRRKDNLRQQL